MRISPAVSINQFTGINERADPLRVGVGKGKLPFVDAVNLDIDDSGMVTLRDGYDSAILGNFSDLWSFKNTCLFNNQGTLKALSSDLKTTTTIITGLDPTAPISYVPVNDDIYLTNNSIIGYVRAGAFNALSDPGKTYKAALPAGHLIEYFNSRLYVARGDVIFYSDPATCQYYDKRHNFIWMGGRVTMMRAVADGIYLSDSEATYFMAGASPSEAVLTKVADYPANEGSCILTDAENIGLKDLTGEVLIWASTKGVCLGAKGGGFVNLTQDRYQMYDSPINAALIRTLAGKTQYLFVSEIQQAEIEAEAFIVALSMEASL